VIKRSSYAYSYETAPWSRVTADCPGAHCGTVTVARYRAGRIVEDMKRLHAEREAAAVLLASADKVRADLNAEIAKLNSRQALLDGRESALAHREAAVAVVEAKLAKLRAAVDGI
jgi:hypothetical protein